MTALRCATALLLTLTFISGEADAQTVACRTRTRLDPCGVVPPPPGNVAPSISGSPAASVDSGTTYVFRPVATDGDGDPLIFSIVNRPPWASFNARSGTLSGKPGHYAVGEYVDIRISVSDGYRRVSLPAFSITVAQGNRRPRISGTPPLAAVAGQVYAFTPLARDADGDVLTFSIQNRPAWASFNAATGALTGTPGHSAVGEYGGVTIQVSDGALSASLSPFAIDVEQAALGSATLHWQAPTTRTDGTPLTNLAGYHVRYGTASGNYPNLLTIPNGGLTSAVIENLPPATWYFVVNAYDSGGGESAYTNPVSKTIP